jgi:hypothetical protein
MDRGELHFHEQTNLITAYVEHLKYIGRDAF